MEPQMVSANRQPMPLKRSRQRSGFRIALLGLTVLLGTANVGAQSFSCSIGKQPACLDYGDKVCSSLGKCVDQSAACFDTYQCDYEGFTCKSNVTEIADRMNNLVSDYDDLVDRFNDLLSTHDDLIAKHNNLVSDYDDAISKVRRISSNYEDYVTCVEDADDLDEAQFCTAY